MKHPTFRHFTLGALLILAATLSPPTFQPGSAATYAQQLPNVLRDVTYCSPGGVDLKMDVYMPLTRDLRPAPGVVYIHGGGWTSGDKSEAALGAAQLSTLGYVVASINYRLAPQHRWPAQIEDVKCAVRHLRANAAGYRLDSSRIGVLGASAGGQLSALMGLTGPQAGFEGDGGYPGVSTRVQAVVDIFGPTDFTTMNLEPQRSEVEQLLGMPLEQAGEVLRRASPVTYVSSDAPPFLILHGDKDSVVPISQSRDLYNRLTSVGVPAEFVVIKNSGHRFLQVGSEPISPSFIEIGRIVAGFLDKYLRAGRTTRLFPETGKTVGGEFLQYWLEHGGLAQQGYPISEEMQEVSDTDGKTYTVQYFERAVFELHPENPTETRVLLSLLGVFRYKDKYAGGAGGQVPNTSPGSVLFPETGRRLGGVFLEYWRQNGGLAQQGYPISDEFMEVSSLDGKTYLVQYFERAVFEYHPENPPPYNVLLSQLGTFRYTARYAP